MNTSHLQLAQIIVLFVLRGSVSEIKAHFLFGDKFGNKRKIWQNLCSLHLNTTLWGQIIALFGLRGSVSEIFYRFYRFFQFPINRLISNHWRSDSKNIKFGNHEPHIFALWQNFATNKKFGKLCVYYIWILPIWAQIIVPFDIRGPVSEIMAHFLFGDKFDDKRKIWQNLCLLHMNTTRWAQIIVLFILRGSVSEIKAHFLFGDKFGDKDKICVYYI